MITLERLDNDLTGWLANTLITPGLLRPEAFEAAFVAVVTGAHAEPDIAWSAFYRNTLSALDGAAVPGGTNAELAPVHQRATELVLGSTVLELGCCFGFLALRLARAGYRVTAMDICPGTVRLLTRMATQLELPLHTVVGDAHTTPFADGAADTVLAIHLLEHLPEASAKVVLAEMLRLARRRVVVAVPYEATPDPAWGHVRRFDQESLRSLGQQTGRPFRVVDHHGGWLVIDTGTRRGAMTLEEQPQ